MDDVTHRFDERVDDYVKWRPDYPDEAVQHVIAALGLTYGSKVADIGSGTGKLSRPFLESEVNVIGVEPNEPMRRAGDLLLGSFEGFDGVDGKAESTGLENQSVDGIIAGQAFHWFDAKACSEEWRRILKPGKGISLVWNCRHLEGTPFAEAYESFLQQWGIDYDEVSEQYEKGDDLKTVLGSSYDQRSFLNRQVLPLEGLVGRILSCSYMPGQKSANYAEMEGAISEMFHAHSENGRVTVLYDTNVYWNTRID